MAAILRVKRLNDGEPLEALVIACKRLKSSEKDEESETVTSPPLTTVLKFAGTVVNQENNVVEHIVKSLGKDELKSNFKQHPVDVLKESRRKVKQASVENRYKVVNCHRSLDISNAEELEEKVMTVIDVEDSLSCAVNTASNSKDDQSYVYDLYYAQTAGDICIDESMLIHGIDQELVFDTYRTAYSESDGESEDSNSESNWRNDYPDSDNSMDSINEADILKAVMYVKEESDLSSDEDFAYGLNEADVEKYGYTYARYKAIVCKELASSDTESSACCSEGVRNLNLDSKSDISSDEEFLYGQEEADFEMFGGYMFEKHTAVVIEELDSSDSECFETASPAETSETESDDD